MIMISSISRTLFSLTRTLHHNYHIVNLLQSKNEAQLVKLNPNLFHLYLQKMHNYTFNQRFVVLLATDAYRTNQSRQTFYKIITYADKNIHLFKSRISLVTLLTQSYHYKYDNKEIIIKMVERSLQLPEPSEAGFSFYNLRLIIAIDQLVGLDCFPEEFYNKIDFKQFRPLAIAMVIELFYQKQLQDKYKIVQKLVDLFVQCQAFIPFADVHHLSYAVRKIDNKKFKDCFFRVRRRVQESIGEKKESVSEERFVLDEKELLNNFRQILLEKYRC